MKIISFLTHYFSNSDVDQVTRDQTISAKRPIRRESLLAVVLAVSLSDFVSSMMFTDNCPSHMRIFLPLVCSDGNILFDGLVSTSISSFLKPKLDRPAALLCLLLIAVNWVLSIDFKCIAGGSYLGFPPNLYAVVS